MQDERASPPSCGTLVSVNVGTPRPITYFRHQFQSAIWKEPVSGPVPVRGVHVGADVQADPSVHGGTNKAVYAYGMSDLSWWSEQLDRELPPGTFGENLTVEGLAVSSAVVGEQWRIGDVVLQVTEPRLPCFKLGTRMGDGRFPKRFGRAARFGAYLRIIAEGTIQAGDAVEVFDRPDHGVTVALMGRMRLGERELAAAVLAAPELPEGWRLVAEHYLARRSA